MIRFYLLLHIVLAFFLIGAGYLSASNIINSDAEGFTFWIVLVISAIISCYGAYKLIWLFQHRNLWNRD